MRSISTIGLDIGKSVFQVHGVDAAGQVAKMSARPADWPLRLRYSAGCGPTTVRDRMHLDQLKRREFITLLGGAVAAWPFAAHAQQPDRLRRIGVLMSVPESDPEAQAWLSAFSEGLQHLGWTAGHNIRLDYRWAAPVDAESRQRVSKELVALQPDLVLTQNTVRTARKGGSGGLP